MYSSHSSSFCQRLDRQQGLLANSVGVDVIIKLTSIVKLLYLVLPVEYNLHLNKLF